MTSDRHDIAFTCLCTPSPTCPPCQFWMSIISGITLPRTPTSVTADTEAGAHCPSTPLSPFPSPAVPMPSVSSHDICQGPHSFTVWFYIQQSWSVQQSSSLALRDLLIPPEGWNHFHSFTLLLSFSCIRNQIIILSFKPLRVTVSKLLWKKIPIDT